MIKKRISFGSSDVGVARAYEKALAGEVERARVALSAELKTDKELLEAAISDNFENARKNVAVAAELFCDEGSTEVSSFLRRGAAHNTVATLVSVGGNIVKNLIDGTLSAADYFSTVNCSVTIADGVASVCGTSDSENFMAVSREYIPVLGHVYYTSVMVYNINCSSVGLPVGEGWNFTPVSERAAWSRLCGTCVCSAPSNNHWNLYLYHAAHAVKGDEFRFTAPLLVDLTEMFGAGNEPSPEECNALFATVGALPFGITVARPTRLKSVGYNLADSSSVLVGRGVKFLNIAYNESALSQGGLLRFNCDGITFQASIVADIPVWSRLEFIVSAASDGGILLYDGRLVASDVFVYGTADENPSYTTFVREYSVGEGAGSIVVVPCLPCKAGAGENNGYSIGHFVDGRFVDTKITGVYYSPLNPLENMGEARVAILNRDGAGRGYLPEYGGFLLVEVADTVNFCVHFVRDGKRSVPHFAAYTERSLPLPSVADYSPLGLAGVAVNGSAARDSINLRESVYTKSIGTLSLKDFTFLQDDSHPNSFYTKPSRVGEYNIAWNSTPNFLNSIFSTVSKQSFDNAEGNMLLSCNVDYGHLLLRCASVATAAQMNAFIQALPDDDARFFYQLAIPERHTVEADSGARYLVDSYGTEEFCGSAVPLADCVIFYMRSLAGEARTLHDGLMNGLACNDIEQLVERLSNVATLGLTDSVPTAAPVGRQILVNYDTMECYIGINGGWLKFSVEELII